MLSTERDFLPSNLKPLDGEIPSAQPLEKLKEAAPVDPSSVPASSSTSYAKLLQKNQAFLEQVGSNPMLDAVIDEVDQRRIRIGSQWLVDYASCNYLGLDFDEEVIAGIPDMVSSWGTHPSWSRMLGSPRIYEEIEEKIASLLDVESVLVVPSLSMANLECIFILSQGGDLFLDRKSHRTLYEGAARARGLGARLSVFDSDELDELESQLRESSAENKLILIDGVYSMHGKYPNLSRVAALARTYDAWIYLDDAHGFGIVGERSPDEQCPYGLRGNGIVKHLGESYDRIIYLACLSKSYSSYSAFICCSREVKRLLKCTMASYLYSGPAPFATLASALIGLEVNNKRGDDIRMKLYALCSKLNQAINKMRFRNENNTNFPIFNIYFEESVDFSSLTSFLFERGIYVTLCPYPMVQRQDVGFRIQLTATHTDDQIEELIAVLEEIDGKFPVQKVAD